MLNTLSETFQRITKEMNRVHTPSICKYHNVQWKTSTGLLKQRLNKTMYTENSKKEDY